MSTCPDCAMKLEKFYSGTGQVLYVCSGAKVIPLKLVNGVPISMAIYCGAVNDNSPMGALRKLTGLDSDALQQYVDEVYSRVGKTIPMEQLIPRVSRMLMLGIAKENVLTAIGDMFRVSLKLSIPITSSFERLVMGLINKSAMRLDNFGINMYGQAKDDQWVNKALAQLTEVASKI